MARKRQLKVSQDTCLLEKSQRKKKGLARMLKLLFSAGANSLAPRLQGKIQTKHDSSEHPWWAALPTSCCGHLVLSSLSASSHISPDSFPPNHRPSGMNPSTYRLTAQRCRPSLGLRSRPGPPLSSGALPALTVPGHLPLHDSF